MIRCVKFTSLNSSIIVTQAVFRRKGLEVGNFSFVYANKETSAYPEYALSIENCSISDLEIEIEWIDINAIRYYKGSFSVCSNVGFAIPKEYDNIHFRFVGVGRVYIIGFYDYEALLLCKVKGDEIAFDFDNPFPPIPSVSYEDYCKATGGYVKVELRNDCMKQCLYRVNICFDNVSNRRCDFVDVCRFDGTFDKTHDGRLMQYHTAGEPKRIAVRWHMEKIEYAGYFWLEEEQLTAIFERFYGAHPETKADFIIRIDAENKKYELALYRQGLKEPVVIPKSAYQLIVFKNKFEDYRSENYNQPRGAWIW